MPVPSTAVDISTTASSNSPAGSDLIGNTLDEYIRSIQAILKQQMSQGADLASSSTLALLADGNTFDVTGTTTISGISSTYSWTGRVVCLKFDGALTLTHNATTLILPGGVDITTSAGDIAVFRQDASGEWRCLSYNYAGAVVFTANSSTPAMKITQHGSGNALEVYATDEGAPSPSEKIRVTKDGVAIGTTIALDPTTTTNEGHYYSYGNALAISRSGSVVLLLQRTTSDGAVAAFYRQTTQVGSISVTGSATTYATSSDYRLKDNVADLTDSGSFIDSLIPRTWVWKSTGEVGSGFLAHELQSVSPSSVTGTKDEIDEQGKPVYQAVEYGSAEVIANLVAEVKSLRARVATLETE